MGADVVKVENPGVGDPGRSVGRTTSADANYFLQYNSGKRSVAVNLKDPKGLEIVKNLAKKLDGRMKAAGVPDRFAQGAADAVDKREQRRRDTAAGLVPFACKLPGELVKRLHERAAAHDGGVNALVAAALEQALK